jgi:pyruvate formate lyase activating enzyme
MKNLKKEWNMSSLNKIIIGGINPNSFIDYPKAISYVIFLSGCNFKCPFCHNSSIVNNKTTPIDINTVINQLKERKHFIDAVVVTGGEPTIYGEDLITLLSLIKELGYKVKLDTNGTNPKLLKKIIDNKLIDFIAMDIKNTFSKYEETVNCKVNIDNIKESIDLIKENRIKYIFRTTVNKTNHTKEDIEEIISYIDDKNYILQNYKYSDEQIEKKDLGNFKEEELNEIKESLSIEMIA